MKNILFLFILILTAAQLSAQCPGPAQRNALINLQRAIEVETTRAGQIPLTDTCGNQRYAQYVEINPDTINYIPASSGNTQNLSEFVRDTLGTLWYIDWQGNAVSFAGGAGCDTDWLEISDNNCPDALTDSIYKYRYVAIGARYVFPGAELLVNDSISSGITVIQGFRNSRLALWDSNAGTFSMIDHGGAAPIWYMPVDANLIFKTTGGTPQTPIGSQVNHFAINAQDSTIQMNQYPRTRVDTQAVMNFLYTDPVGKVRSRDVAYLTDTLGFGANIYNSDGNILAGVFRAVGIDSMAELGFGYPSGPDAFRVYGGDDSTAASGYVQVRGPGDNHGRVFASSEYVSMIKQNSESQSYIEFGPDDAGISVVIDDVTPEQGTVLVSNADGFFHFAQIDTLSGIPNIYNSNGVIENETERAVIVDTLASLTFSTPIDGGDLQLLEMVAGDGTGANSSVSLRAGTDGSTNKISIEDGVGIEAYWQDAQRVYISDVQESNIIWQDGTEFHVEGSVDTGTYFIIADNTVPTLYAGAASGTAETELHMDAATGEESFMLRTSGDNGDVQAFVSGTLATVSTTPQLVVAAYDANAPQYSLNEIRIDTAGVGINTRGGVGNDGDILHSNGEKTYWAPPSGAETIYTDNGTIEDAARTVTLAENGILNFAYNDDASAIEVDDFGTVTMSSKDGESTITITDGIEINANGLTENIELNADQGSVRIGASATVDLMPNGGGVVGIGTSGTPTQIFFADADGGGHGTYIVAGDQSGNIYWELPEVAPAEGEVLMGTSTDALIWERPIPAGVLSADQLSWTGGGDWQPVNANRLLFVQASGTITPSVGVTEIIVNDTATTSTVNLNYTPGELDGASYAQPYTTVRYIYNWGSGDCTVDTNQDWTFRIRGDGTGNATLTIPAGESYKLIWIQGSSEATSSFWCIKIE